MGLPELHSVVIGANMTAAAHLPRGAARRHRAHGAFEAAAMATPNATALSSRAAASASRTQTS